MCVWVQCVPVHVLRAQALGIRIPSLGCLTGQTGGHAGKNPGPLRYPFTLLRFPVGHLVGREKREEKGGRGGGSPPSPPKVIVGLTGNCERNATALPSRPRPCYPVTLEGTLTPFHTECFSGPFESVSPHQGPHRHRHRGLTRFTSFPNVSL